MSESRPLLVAAHLPSTLRIPLRNALGEEHRIAEAVDWADLAEIVRRRPVDLVVVDPAVGGNVDVTAVMDIMEQFPRTPVVVYTSLGPKSVGAMAELSRRGLKEIVLHRYDDSPERFHRVIERVAKKPSRLDILSGLSAGLQQLPEQTVKAIEQLFEKPQIFLTAADVASAAGVTLSTLYRSLKGAGFPSPRRLLIAARVLRAHTYMREPGHSVQEVAGKLGYSHPRILTRHTCLALGVKPRHLRRRMSDEAVVGRLVEWIYDTHAAE